MTENRTELKKFGMIMGTIIPALFGILLPWLFGKVHPLWPWVLGGVFWVFALFFPLLLRRVHILWVKIGEVLGWFNSRIILGAIFFLLITPMGLVMRVLKRKSLKLDYEVDESSYRIRITEGETKNMRVPY